MDVDFYSDLSLENTEFFNSASNCNKNNAFSNKMEASSAVLLKRKIKLEPVDVAPKVWLTITDSAPIFPV